MASTTDQSQPSQVGSSSQPDEELQDGPQRTASPNGHQNPNNEVSFRQKEAMLDFIMAHRELVLSEHLNEDLWTQLTNKLNNLEGAVKSCGDWKKVWKLWCATYYRRKNDLSISLLDLKLITFLENITDEVEEKKKIELKQFAFNTTSLIKARDLSNMIAAVPLPGKSYLIQMVGFLKLSEETEEAYQTKVNFNSQTLSDLMLKKQELEKDILYTSKLLDENEIHAVSAYQEKSEHLKKIKGYLQRLFSR